MLLFLLLSIQRPLEACAQVVRRPSLINQPSVDYAKTCLAAIEVTTTLQCHGQKLVGATRDANTYS